MTPRRCLGCRKKIPSGSRCERCQTANERERARHRPRPEHYRGDWKKISREMRQAHVRQYGLVCPGYGKRGQHRVAHFRDLTVDHVIAGSREGGLVVLCRSCNASKGDR